MFVMLLKYLKPLEEVDKFLVPHREFLDENFAQKKFICAGRQISGAGGVILAAVDNLEEAKSIAHKDPFFINKVADYDFIEFVPRKYDERFACFLNP